MLRAPRVDAPEAAHRHRVLIVEDDPAAALLLDAVISGMGHDAVTVSSGLAAIDATADEGFDLALLDLGLPDVDGFEVARRLRGNGGLGHLPIVFVSGEQGTSARLEGFEVGAADFITKPYDIPEVRARVQHQLEMQRLRRELERAAALLEGRVKERTEELSRRMVELDSEVDRRRRLEDELRHLAETDPVTGALNQRGFPEGLTRWRSDRSAGLVAAVEIDGWESFTGMLGHADADRMLASIAARLAGDDHRPPVGRYGASLFVTASPLLQGSMAVAIDRLRSMLEEPVKVGRRTMRPSFTIGVVELRTVTGTDELVRDATLALHVAKRDPGSTVVLDDDRRAGFADDLALEQELWGAAARSELVLQYQPIFDADSLDHSGAEALIRWHHPTRGLVSPGRFIPIAERSGAISEIGRWTLREAARQLVEWRAARAVHEGFHVAVNLSAVDAIDPGLPGIVARTLDDAGLPPSALELELTETAVLRHGSVAADVLGELRDAGVGICLDDFGTGNSSLTLLQQTPADVVKIDRSFVSCMSENADCRAIVESTITLAHRLGMRVVGEGVETPGQLDLLAEFGCDLVQGFLLARPLDPGDLARSAARDALR